MTRSYRYLPVLSSIDRSMNTFEFTRGLTQTGTPVGACHCGNSGLAFPEKRMKLGKLVLVGWHCLLCRCDEHTPETHALWSDAQRRGKDVESSTTDLPGCGRRCTRDEELALLATPFPTFEEWAKENSTAALREKARS